MNIRNKEAEISDMRFWKIRVLQNGVQLFVLGEICPLSYILLLLRLEGGQR